MTSWEKNICQKLDENIQTLGTNLFIVCEQIVVKEQNSGLGELHQSVQNHLLSEADLQCPPLPAAQSFKGCFVFHQLSVSVHQCFLSFPVSV